MIRPIDPAQALHDLRSACLREARRYALDEADAQDAVQDAWLRAWRYREACRDPDDPLPWLLAITRNEALRRRRARAAAVGEVTGEQPDVHADDEMARAGLRVDVTRALRGLTPRERRLVALRYALDLTHAEVALEVGAEEGTVRVQLHRARSRLRTLMAF